ncbi:MAG: hypothetical protein IKS41_07085 [Alphaproteobacteria bacterium]|nr:hypothetical protein [Alphaproteobacteria bacterium]
MSVSDNIFQMYQRFYAQKAVLSAAPVLSINPNEMGVAEFPTEKALTEMEAVAAYLMGLSSLKNISFDKQIKIVKESYEGQDFWQNLLYDFLELRLDVEESHIKEEDEEISDKLKEILYDLKMQERNIEDLVQYYTEKIEKEKFHVDAKALIRNYFKMFKKDQKTAWQVLTTNPAFFSPIKARDASGKEILSPAKAIAENQKLAQFLKGLK